MARSFAITMKDGSTIPMQDGSTIAKDPIRADAKGHAEVVFKVTNNTDHPARALAKVIPLGETKREWLSINGEDERDFAPRADQDFTVSFDAPASQPAGAKPAGSTAPTAGAPATPEVHKYPFRFDVASPLDPQEDFTQGPIVTVEVMPAPVVKPKSKLWILFVVLGVVLLIGIIVLVLVFWNGDTGTDADESPTPTPDESATATETPTPTTPVDNGFAVTNQPIVNFAVWATSATPLVGDFNGDHRTDVALTGPSGWSTLPVAFSNGDGNFNVTNQPISNFAVWATTTNAKPLGGDFNGDGRTDVALTGPSGWGTLPVAFSNGDGNFTVTNQSIANFASWAATTNAQPLVGDFNHDGRTDVALTGPSGWASLPVAFSL